MHSSPARLIILHLIAVLFTIFNISSITIVGIPNLVPLLDLMMIYYFAIYRPHVFGIWFLFLLGVWSDSLNGMPLGITSLCYIITTKVFNVVNSRMDIKENFEQIFKQYVVFAFTILFLKWMFLSIYRSEVYNILTPIAQLVISSIAYIFVHRFFDYLNQKLIEESGA